MSQTEAMIRNVVREVLAQMGRPTTAPAASASHTGRRGVFTCVNEAVAAATEAFEQLSERTREDRKRIIDH
ncbi:MAG: aldehyde dehydrogenase EutE, partial [Planctomycetia bacterium]|nr:aldehyde dehydrogenase EutE [Planctomycetia bacterium]